MPIWFTKPQSIVTKLLQDKEAIILARMELDSNLELIEKKLDYYKTQKVTTEKTEDFSVQSNDQTGMVAAR